MSVRELPTLDEARRVPQRMLKPAPTVIRRRLTKQARKVQIDAFLDAVWARDDRRSRASGKPVFHVSTDPAKRGEVHHLKKRSTSPAERTDRRNGVLLSAEEHALAEAWPPRLDIRGTNADQVLTFIRRDEGGRELWRRTS